MNFFSNKIKNATILLLVLLIAYLSYSINIFNVASNDWFKNHQIDSEQLVLDGLLNGAAGNNEVVLGRYTRPGVVNQTLVARELYDEGNISGDFGQYKSQFGLQVKTFAILSKIGLNNVSILHSIIALLMSAVIVAMFGCIWRDFSLLPALIFTSVYIFSPWVVVFSRNLYWVSFTWFLPLLTAMWLAPRIYTDKSKMFLMLGILYFTYLLKLLCGYEYMTTIFFATCVPIVYHGVCTKQKMVLIFNQIVLSGMALLFAFFCALYLHSKSISNNDESGISQIILTAKKRLTSDSPLEVVKKTCNGNSDCEKLMTDSLTSNPIKVVGRYFIMGDFLPWVSVYQFNESNKENLKIASKNISVSGIKTLYAAIGIYGFIDVAIFIATKAVSAISFIFLIFILIKSFKKFPKEIKAVVILSFISPLSWFFAAKGHSYVHTHMNYVLWYLPFIPFCVLALTTLGNNKGAVEK